MMKNLSDELYQLYLETSKHSNYQELAPNISAQIPYKELKIVSRHENARWRYMHKHIDFTNKKVVDIGGNTGFFSFSALDKGADFVDYYEGNNAHAKFVSLASQIPEYQERVHVHEQYIDLETQDIPKLTDITLLLNVLHHIGDDYGNVNVSEQIALQHIQNVLDRIAKQTSLLILQLGFNWKGNIHYPLFKEGTKSEMIDFIKDVSDEKWDVLHIGIAEKNGNSLEYKELDNSNLARVDAIGEFLNRPIFILRSKQYGGV